MTTIDDIIAVKAEIAALEEKKKLLEETYISERADAMNVLADNEYGCGTTSWEENGHTVKIEVKKNVKWDNAMLKEKYKQLGVDADNYIDVKMSVSETNFKKWDNKIKTFFEPARTVTPTKPYITITDKE